MPGTVNYLLRIERYRNRAEELRSVAASMQSSECRDTLCRLAESYELMAQTAQQSAVRDEDIAQAK
jgi:hypothetical protein